MPLSEFDKCGMASNAENSAFLKTRQSKNHTLDHTLRGDVV
jgi:hypothetical protein